MNISPSRTLCWLDEISQSRKHSHNGSTWLLPALPILLSRSYATACRLSFSRLRHSFSDGARWRKAMQGRLRNDCYFYALRFTLLELLHLHAKIHHSSCRNKRGHKTRELHFYRHHRVVVFYFWFCFLGEFYFDPLF